MTENSFYGLGIAPNILAVLDKLNFKVPTPIQERSIPESIEGKDLIGIAETGTGKTLAFGIPMVQAALSGKRGLVVLPTRELALQVHKAMDQVGGPLGVRSVLIIGGESMDRQLRDIRKAPMLQAVGMLVLDEADRMLDMGFAPQLKRILSETPPERQTMLFSATMPDDIVRIANHHMRLPTRVEVAPSGTTAPRVTQELFFVRKEDKPRLLEKLLTEYAGSVLVFSRTKFGAKRIMRSVREQGHTASELHSNKSLNQRREALEGFRNGKYRVLAATDIAARGIDVKGIELVVNYDLPTNPEDYVHRIGRTGRAGGAGHAVSFATPDQRGDVKGIERLIRATLPLSRLPANLPEPRMEEARPPRPPRPYGRPHRPAFRRSSGRPSFRRSGR
ncbi:MAG: DEAD/DEAH box helicase domain protein [Parcubacteria group bacterium GW2011_GWA1_59_11]|nr:MAG: DEAD/DEAH box helicase domain protein [Parcubacteria group bacterium GW2011_GWA1_59_11]